MSNKKTPIEKQEHIQNALRRVEDIISDYLFDRENTWILTQLFQLQEDLEKAFIVEGLTSNTKQEKRN